MRRISTFRITAIVLVAVAAAGAGYWLSLREEQPAHPNIGTQSDREAIMRLALSKAESVRDAITPLFPVPPRPEEQQRAIEAWMSRREMRLADASLAACSDSMPRPHCLDGRFLLDAREDVNVPRELWSQLLEVNAKHANLPGSLGEGIRRIPAADVHGYYDPVEGCPPDGRRLGFDILWVGQPVFTPDGDSAVIAVQLDGYDSPGQSVSVGMYRREHSIWKEVASGQSWKRWIGLGGKGCRPM